MSEKKKAAAPAKLNFSELAKIRKSNFLRFDGNAEYIFKELCLPNEKSEQYTAKVSKIEEDKPISDIYEEVSFYAPSSLETQIAKLGLGHAFYYVKYLGKKQHPTQKAVQYHSFIVYASDDGVKWISSKNDENNSENNSENPKPIKANKEGKKNE